MKKKLRLKQSVIDVLILGSLFIVMIGGVVLLNHRMGQLNHQKMTEIAATIQSKK